MSRWVELILVSVFWRKRLSCASVEVRSCIVLVVVEERGTCRVAVSCRVARKQHVAGALAGRLLHVSSQQPKSRHSVANPGTLLQARNPGTLLQPRGSAFPPVSQRSLASAASLHLDATSTDHGERAGPQVNWFRPGSRPALEHPVRCASGKRCPSAIVLVGTVEECASQSDRLKVVFYKVGIT